MDRRTRSRTAARRRPRLLLHSAVAVVATGAAAVLSSGVAYAYWAATATGNVQAGAMTAAALRVSAAGAPSASLYPGRTEDVAFTLANPNPYGVRITTLTAVTVTSSDAAACPSSNIVVSSTVSAAVAAGGWALPTPISVPAGSSGVPGTLSGLITMTAAAPDGCQGRTFDIALTFSGSQV